MNKIIVVCVVLAIIVGLAAIWWPCLWLVVVILLLAPVAFVGWLWAYEECGLKNLAIMKDDSRGLHECKGTLPQALYGYGEAVDGCFEEPDWRLWVTNGEYSSQVNFCPYCGYKARVIAIMEQP